MLKVDNLRAGVGGSQVLQGVGLEIGKGEIHALMGPNGSGKSSLALTLAGHPAYKVNGKSRVTMNGKSLLKMEPQERVREGMFLAFQSPIAVPGVSYFSFLRQAYQSVKKKHVAVLPFKRKVEGIMKRVGVEKELLSRAVNDGFSGGERKRMEIVQMLVLEPKLLVLDEIDSGLDVDSLKMVAGVIEEVAKQGAGVLVITHYKRVLEYLKPNKVHVMKGGRVVASGGEELVGRIESKGYGGI